MEFFVYIIYSSSHDKYYVGQTNNVNNRLIRHNKGLEKYTRKGTPWILKAFKGFPTRKQAMNEERRIKNFKSRKRIELWIEVVGAEK